MQLTFSQAKACIEASVAAGDMTPMVLQASPGAGKTALGKAINLSQGMSQEEANKLLCRLPLADPADLVGIPQFSNRDGQTETRFAIPAFLADVTRIAAKYPHVVLLWDEIGQAAPAVANAVSGVMGDGLLGDWRLPKNVFQLGTANRAKDKAHSIQLPTQLGNRCEVHELVFSSQDFSRYWHNKGLDPLVLAYLRYKGWEPVQDFNPARLVNGTPRSWELAALVDPNLPEDIYQLKIAGRVGDGWAIEYVEFRRIFSLLPDATQIRANPTTTQIPDDMGARWGSIYQLIKDTNDRVFDRDMTYVRRFPAEFASAWVQDAVDRHPDLRKTRAYSEWVMEDAANMV